MRLLKLLFGVALGVLVVSTAALVATLIMRGRVGENAVAALPPPALSSRAPAAAPSVLLLRSAATARHFANVPDGTADAYERRIEDWRRRLEGEGAAVRIVDEAAVRAQAHGRGLVLVAPSAAALDDATLARIVGLVEEGAGLIATWTFALHDAEDGWRGYGALARLAGLTLLPDGDRTEAPRFVALHGQASLTVGLPAGARLEIQPYDRPLPVTSAAAVGDYVEWSMLTRGSGASPPQTAITRATVGAGRVVWMNFEPAALVGGGVGPDRLAMLVRNALAWTSRTPLGALETWPNGARMAAALGLDAEDRFDESREIATRLAASQVPYTSFVLTSLASTHPDALAALAATSELASHTHDHRVLSAQGEDQQRR